MNPPADISPTDHHPRTSPWCRWALAAILASGLALRFCGLSHDLHEGSDYHPDTSKQIRAEQRFLGGNYYCHTGILDYDAYPYFNAHLVEYACRAGMAVADGAQALVGVPVQHKAPDFYTLFWLTRILNCLLASALILVLFKIGRENFGVGAGLVGALLLAVSPVDMASCHFATADSTAVFFAMLTVLFAFRVHREGRYHDYFFAAVSAACAFASKYHAGMAVLAVLVAHVLRAGSLRGLLQPASLRRALLMAAVGIGTLFIAIPNLRTDFSETVVNIVNFFGQISSLRGVPDEVRNGGRIAKLLFSMHRNLPILWDVLGPLVVAAVVFSLAHLRKREPRHMILCALPLAYFLIGVSLRPLSHPVYHTLMTSSLFLMAAAVFTWPLSVAPRARFWLAAARVLAVALAAGYLLHYSAREAFFFWHQDTSRNALAWTLENVPRAFDIGYGKYTFNSLDFATGTNGTPGTLWARSNLQPYVPEGPTFSWKRFALQDESLTVFNNTTIELLLGSSAWIRADAMMPTLQRVPSESGNQFIFDNGPEFVRSEKQALVAPNLSLTRWLVADVPLTRAWVAVQNGGIANHLRWSFGSARGAWAMAPDEFRWLQIDRPRGQFPSTRTRSFYRWTASAAYGRARVMLATGDGTIGALLSNAGRSADAVPYLQRAAIEKQNPSLAAQSIIDARRSSAPAGPVVRTEIADLAARTLRVDGAGALRELYGVNPCYLDALGGISLDVARLDWMGFYPILDPDTPCGRALRSVADDRSNGCVRAGPLMLDPGWYEVTVRLRAIQEMRTPSDMRLQLIDRHAAVRFEQTAALENIPSDRCREIRIGCAVPVGMPETMLELRPSTNGALVIESIRVAPDHLSSVKSLARNFDPGQSREQDVSRSNTTVEATSAFRPADTLFRSGIRLVGARVSEQSLQRGHAMHLDLVWSMESPDVPVCDLLVFVHMLDESGETAFGGDFPLATSLREGAVANSSFPPTHSVAIPSHVKPGVYRIRLGLCYQQSGKRERIVATALEKERNGVFLPQTLTLIE